MEEDKWVFVVNYERIRDGKESKSGWMKFKFMSTMILMNVDN